MEDAQTVIALPGWQVIVEAGVRLEYQPDMEALARQLLPELVKIVGEVPWIHSEQQRRNIEHIGAHQTACLQYIASMLGLEQPGIAMTNTFYDLFQLQQAIAAGQYVQSFRLWDQATVLRLLRAGAVVDGITYDKETDSCILTVPFNIDMDTPLPAPQLALLCNQHESLQSALTSVRQAILSYAEALHALSEPYVLFHETAEAGMVGSSMVGGIQLHSAFRRWFCEGVAHYIAEQAIWQLFGQDAYQQVLVRYDPAQYEAYRPQVDLWSWRAREWGALEAVPANPHLRLAHYAFAAEEIRELVRRHGEDTIAHIMTWFMHENARPYTPTILQAIQAVTGEDMVGRLQQYGQEADDAFRGIAIRKLRYFVLMDDVVISLTSIELSPGQPVLLAQGADLEFFFRYEGLALAHPVPMQIEVTDGVTRMGYAEFVLEGESTMYVSKRRLRLQDKMMTGEKAYTLTVTINGKVWMANPIVITAP